MFHKCKQKIQYLHRPLNNTDDTGKQFPFIIQSIQKLFCLLLAIKNIYLIFSRCICARRRHACNFWRTLWWPSNIWQCTNSLSRPISIPSRVSSLRRESVPTVWDHHWCYTGMDKTNFLHLPITTIWRLKYHPREIQILHEKLMAERTGKWR